MANLKARVDAVLILVLVEDGLGVVRKKFDTSLWKVLILVLVEDGLGVENINLSAAKFRSLNPCFGGRWSRSCNRLVG